jgi:galactose mutarotase-like enzyme
VAEIEQRQYETYILRDETSNARAEVVPERGGILTQWQVQEHPLLYLDQERFRDPTLSVRGGIPILFPICGNLPDNTYTYQNQSYRLKQHGFAREFPWQVIDNSQPDRLTIQLRSNEQTLALYPFPFELTFTYQLQGNRLIIAQRYTNQGSVPMPFATGVHPYFTVVDKSQLAIDIPSTTLQDNVTQTIRPFDGNFDFTLDEIDWAFPGVSRTSATVSDRGRGLQLTLDYDALFTTLVFWALKGKNFYCLEPWSAPRNALNTGESLLHLTPGNSLELRVSFTVQT